MTQNLENATVSVSPAMQAALSRLKKTAEASAELRQRIDVNKKQLAALLVGKPKLAKGAYVDGNAEARKQLEKLNAEIQRLEDLGGGLELALEENKLDQAEAESAFEQLRRDEAAATLPALAQLRADARAEFEQHLKAAGECLARVSLAVGQYNAKAVEAGLAKPGTAVEPWFAVRGELAAIVARELGKARGLESWLDLEFAERALLATKR